MHNQFMGKYVGFDPGGVGALGWAVVSGEAFPLRLVGHGIADHAQGAFEDAMSCSGSGTNAVGIDAPLFWNPSGDRVADQIVRKAVTRLGCPGGTVSSVNSLQGACLIQGMLLAMMCQQRAMNENATTEAHPKALLWLLGNATRERRPANLAISDLDSYVVGSKIRGVSVHERDAMLGAVAAFAMHTRLTGWRDLYAEEANSITPLKPPPGYWMPIPTELQRPTRSR